MYLSKKRLEKVINQLLSISDRQLKNNCKNNIFLVIYIITRDK